MKWRFLAGFLSATTLIAFGGAISGTLAWYNYTTRAEASYSGTTVYNTRQLEVGLNLTAFTDSQYEAFKSSVQIFSYVTFEEFEDDRRYMFLNAGVTLDYHILDTYLKFASYAANKTLVPVTSLNYRTNDDEFIIHTSPCKGENRLEKETDKSKYIKLPFAFRVEKVGSTDDKYVSNASIWLTDCESKVDDDSPSADIQKSNSMRLFMDCPTGGDYKKYILNPSASESGLTYTAGVLDLDNDGYYDYLTTYGSGTKESPYGYELLYGVDKDNKDISKKYRGKETYQDVDSSLDNINGNSSDKETTFSSKHKAGYLTYDSFDEIKDDFGYAEYLSIDDILPTVSGNQLSEGSPVCKTAQSDNANERIGEFDMTVYLEGWDYSVIDQNIENKYSLGLTFEISRT